MYIQNATTDLEISSCLRDPRHDHDWDRSFVQTGASECECENLPHNPREKPEIKLGRTKETQMFICVSKCANFSHFQYLEYS